MSPEQSERQIKPQVDEIFLEAFGTTKGRLILAAFAISDQVGILRGLTMERDKTHESIPAAPSDSDPAVSLGLDEKLAPTTTEGVGPEIEDYTDIKTFFDELTAPDTEEIENAELALVAALEGARTVYGLSERQAKKAKWLAETSFWLFNINDPTQK